MSHPFQHLKDDKVSKSRVSSIAKGYATGGAVGHNDAAEDLKMIKATVKPGALKMDAPGKASGGRLDKAPRKPHKAAGGPVGGSSGKKGTNVNIIIAPQGGAAAGGPPTPMLPPPAAGGIGSPSPVPPAGPLMPPPGLGAAGGAPPMPPGAGPMRNGGRAYAKGGKVAGTNDGTATWREGLKNGTQVQHTDGKNDGKDIYRGRQITYAKGGAVSDRKLIGKKFPEDAKKVGYEKANRSYIKNDAFYNKQVDGNKVRDEQISKYDPSDPNADPYYAPDRINGVGRNKGGGVGNSQGQAPMGPRMKGGAEGGLARLQKARMQKGKR